MGIPISLLRKLYGGLVIFTDDILLMAPAKEELTFARDTLIYISSSESRFSDKSQKISTRTMSEYTAFGHGN